MPHGPKQDCICLLDRSQRRGGQIFTRLLVTNRTAGMRLETEREPARNPLGRQKDFDGLGGHVHADSIAGQDGDIDLTVAGHGQFAVGETLWQNTRPVATPSNVHVWRRHHDDGSPGLGVFCQFRATLAKHCEDRKPFFCCALWLS
jgi:hypothetical protein